jgi:DNA-binding HxlR family transcriptional regulator
MQLVVLLHNQSHYATGFPRRIDMLDNRSGCPINLTMEVIGDRWSLVVIRDMMFGNRRHFRELLENSRRASPRIFCLHGSNTSSI